MIIRSSKRISAAPSYAFAEVDRQVRQLRERGMDVIDFGVGDPRSPTPAFVIEALRESAHRHATSGYPSYEGSPAFRRAAAQYLERLCGVTLDPETEILATIGAKEAVFHFPLAFLNNDDIVICPSPGYPPYKTGTVFAGGVPFFLPLLPENGFLPDFRSIPESILPLVRMLWINYPNSPTGACAPRPWFEELVAWAQHHNIIIAADEGCYFELYFQERPTSILEVARKGVIAFYSLSKRNNMTGYRVGFVAGDPALVAAFKRVKTQIDSGVPHFVQEAAIAALADDAHVAAMRDEYRAKKEIILLALAAAGLPPCNSAATFYLWQRAPTGKTGEEFMQQLLELGIVVTPGVWLSDVTADGHNPGSDYVRFALVPTLDEVRAAAERFRTMQR